MSNHYPSWRFHPMLPARVVETVEEDQALDSSWAKAPQAPPDASPGVEAPKSTKGTAAKADVVDTESSTSRKTSGGPRSRAKG